MSWYPAKQNPVSAESLAERRQLDLKHLSVLKMNTIDRTDDPRNRLFIEIQRHYKENKKEAINRLKYEHDKLTITERILKNISKKYKATWKAIQSKSLFLSAMRLSLKVTRSFGMRAKGSLEPVDQSAAGETRLWYLVYPDSILNQVLSVVWWIVLLYQLFMVSLDIGFGIFKISGIGINQEYSILCFFCFNVILGFFSVRLLFHSNRPQEGLRDTAWNYLTSHFFLDLVTTIPMRMFYEKQPSPYFVFFYIPRTVRIILNTLRAENWLSVYLKSFFSTSRVLSLMRTFILTLVCVHISACVWCMFVRLSPKNNWYTK